MSRGDVISFAKICAEIVAKRSGLPISTYFSAIKLRWMITHHENVRKAHEEDDLMFGTVESWIVYVRLHFIRTPRAMMNLVPSAWPAARSRTSTSPM